MRAQLLSLVKNPEFVRRSRWYHLQVVLQLLSLLPAPTGVVFEGRIGDIERVFEHTELLYASRESGGWVIVFALIDGFGQVLLETFLAVESLVP